MSCENDNHRVCFDGSSYDGGYILDIEDIKEIIKSDYYTDDYFDWPWFNFCPTCGLKLNKEKILSKLRIEKEQMPEFYITFGQQYRQEKHPVSYVHPDGYVKIIAKDADQARAKAFEVFGKRWSFFYEEVPKAEHFPLGVLETLYLDNPLVRWLKK